MRKGYFWEVILHLPYNPTVMWQHSVKTHSPVSNGYGLAQTKMSIGSHILVMDMDWHRPKSQEEASYDVEIIRGNLFFLWTGSGVAVQLVILREKAFIMF